MLVSYYSKVNLLYKYMYPLFLTLFPYKPLQCIWCLVAQSCLTLCNPMDCSPPGSSVHGILQARILAWVAILQGIFLTQGSNPGLLHCRQILYHLSHQGSPLLLWLILIWDFSAPCPSSVPGRHYSPTQHLVLLNPVGPSSPQLDGEGRYDPLIGNDI